MSTIEELHGVVSDGLARYRKSNKERIEAAIETGAALVDLKALLPFGEFEGAVKGLGMKVRTARAWMSLANAGFTSATVAEVGGLRAALESLRNPKLAPERVGDIQPAPGGKRNPTE